MSRKDYELVAAVLKDARVGETSLDSLATLRLVSMRLADRFSRNNAKFDYARFMQACGVPSGVSQ